MFQRYSRGQDLLDRVFEHLELIEKDYFGLQFMDLIPEPDNLVRTNTFIVNLSYGKSRNICHYIFAF